MTNTSTTSVPAQPPEKQHMSRPRPHRPEKYPGLPRPLHLAVTTSDEEEEAPEDAPDPEADLTEEQPTMPPAYRTLTYDIVTGTGIDEDYRKILCPHCMNRGFYRLTGRVQINEGDKNILDPFINDNEPP